MTNPESLNAGATSFVPGGGPPKKDTPDPNNDSFTAYAAMMDDIEAEAEAAEEEELTGAMNNVGMGGGGGGAPSGLPAHLAGHAHEFWFPEARDCTCCNGYKHGCQCAPTHGGVCKCSGGIPGSAPPPSAHPPQMGGRGGGGRGGYGGGGRGTGSVMCKFFMSPQGCRFGENCRFSHG